MILCPTGRLMRVAGGWLAVALLVVGCQKNSTPAPGPGASGNWFEDVTEKVGLKFVHDAGPLGRFFMPQSVGSGGAVLDYDNDGRLDIYLLHNAGPQSKSVNQLFHQGADGRFTDVTAGSGLDVAGYFMGVAVGDVNNDGFVDVAITEFRGVRLFLNKGNGTFREVTKEAGLENPGWGISAAFVDYDRDGWLDLVVANYIDYQESQVCYDRAGKVEYCGPNACPGTAPRLYHNLGRPAGAAGGVRFEDVTAKSGLGELAMPGLGVVCADFNGDRWPDILISNDARPNTLWINQHNGTFRNEAGPRGIAYNGMGVAEANMGIALADVDGDGLFDIHIAHLTEENNVLWKQGPPGLFTDATAVCGLANPGWHGTGFGTVFGDFDQDGAPDLAVVNGRVRRSNQPGVMAQVIPELGPHWTSYGERPQIFHNEGAGKFRDISAEAGAFCKTPTIGRGLICGDIDGDGALDLLVTSIAQPARLYRNVVPNKGHWLLVRAVDPALGGRDAYGAEVAVQAGGRRRVGWINPGYSYVSSNDPRAHFGLGSATRVEAIEVIWPDGKAESFPDAAADQVLVLRRGEGKASP